MECFGLFVAAHDAASCYDLRVVAREAFRRKREDDCLENCARELKDTKNRRTEKLQKADKGRDDQAKLSLMRQ